jgi:hypothetical protein
MEPEGSLPFSQQHSTGPYLESDQSHPCHPILSLIRSILLFSTNLCLDLPSHLFPSGFSTNILYSFSFSPCMLHAVAISSSLIWPFLSYLAKNISYEAPHYAVFCIFLSFHLSLVNILFSASCSQTPTICIHPLMSQTKESPLWSSGQSSWLQTQRSWVWFLALPDFLHSSRSGTGSTQPREDKWGATWKKSSSSGLENWD